MVAPQSQAPDDFADGEVGLRFNQESDGDLAPRQFSASDHRKALVGDVRGQGDDRVGGANLVIFKWRKEHGNVSPGPVGDAAFIIGRDWNGRRGIDDTRRKF